MSPEPTCSGDPHWEALANDDTTCSAGTSLGAAHVPPPPAAQAPPQLPGYEVLGELGRGGMGVVYQARQLALNRIVALKLIGFRLDLLGARREQLVQRFRLEAEALARLNHPHIVQVFEVGEHDSLPYMALEYVPGGSLSRLLAQRPLAADEAARLAEGLAQAVHAAHLAGVVHRDLKPDNVLLTFSRDAERSAAAALRSASRLNEGVAKVTDFGLARLLGEAPGVTDSGAVLGTPNYMAPEQARGQHDVGPPADVWALGAILYACLTGRPPFNAASTVETLLQVVQADPVSPRTLQPGLPRDLETICLKCLEKEPERRYASASELADDLRRFLDGVPIKARPIGPLARGWRWCRRHKLPAALLGGLLLSLTGGLTTVTVLYRREASERHRAQTRDRQARELLAAVVDRVADEPRWIDPASQPLRQELAAGLLPHVAEYLDFLERDWEPTAADDRARALAWRASLVRATGRPEDADAALGAAIAGLEGRLAHRPDDEEMRERLATAYLAVATQRRQAGRHREALAALEQAAEWLEPLAQRRPGSAALAGLAIAYQRQALELAAAGQPTESRAVLNRSADVWDRLLRQDTNLRWRVGRITVDVSAAGLAVRTGDVKQAESLYAQARAALEDLFKDRANLRLLADLLAVTCEHQAALHRRARRFPQAEADLNRAATVRRQLIESTADYRSWTLAEARQAIERGRLRLAERRRSDAQQQFATACQLLDALARDNPGPALAALRMQAHSYRGVVQAAGLLTRAAARDSFRTALACLKQVAADPANGGEPTRHLGETAFVLGGALLDRQENTDALAALTQAAAWQQAALAGAPAAVELRQELSKTLYNLAEIHRRLGRLADAAATCRRRAKLWPDHAEQLHDAACEMSRFATASMDDAQREGYLREALELLRRSVDLGLKGPAQVRAEKDLRPLHGRAEFERLLKRMERP